MALTTNQLRILALTRKRHITDFISWIIFFLLTVGFIAIFLWNRYELGIPPHSCPDLLSYMVCFNPANGECTCANDSILWVNAFGVVVRDSLFYTLFMLLPVYLNILFLKRKILDTDFQKAFRYGLYLVSAIVVAFAFAGILFYLFRFTPIQYYIKTKIPFPINAVTIFGACLISTGMMNSRVLDQQKNEISRMRTQTKQMRERLKKMQLSFAKNHIKVGSKNNFKIIALEDIIYFEGDGNEPIIHTKTTDYYGSFRLKDYENLLPNSGFIRVHRRFIIAKDKVIARKGSEIILKGNEENIPIPIGDKYKPFVDNDEYLGFTTVDVRKKKVVK